MIKWKFEFKENIMYPEVKTEQVYDIMKIYEYFVRESGKDATNSEGYVDEYKHQKCCVEVWKQWLEKLEDDQEYFFGNNKRRFSGLFINKITRVQPMDKSKGLAFAIRTIYNDKDLSNKGV